jgi:site-specific recombinase XerD
VQLLRGIMALSPEPALQPDKPIFLNNHHKAYTKNALGHFFRAMKRKHGISTRSSLHGIRHRCASAMIVAGAPMKLVAAQLGHSAVATTEKYYTHLEGQMDAIRAAAELGVPKGAQQ